MRYMGDVKKHHPAYNPDAGYELAGFVWFQGWNDMIDGGAYPNREKPRGYDIMTTARGRTPSKPIRMPPFRRR